MSAISSQSFPTVLATAIRRVVGFGRMGRVLALGWITLRLKPFPLIYLILHTLRNRLMRTRDLRRVADWIRRMDDAQQEMMTADTPHASNELTAEISSRHYL